MRRILSALAICGVALAPQARAVQYSKLGIVTAAKAAGKWEMVKAWINEAGYADEWLAAAYFSDDHPLFVTVTNQVVASGIATCAEVDAFLASARDTAPDALLAGVYRRDMASGAGRARWHGGAPVVRCRTNETTRIIEAVEAYPDGFVYVDPARARRYLTPEEEAERYLRRKEAAANSRAERIARLRADIAALEEVRDSSTDALEVSEAIVALIKKRRQLERLEAAQTNVVTVVVEGGTE